MINILKIIDSPKSDSGREDVDVVVDGVDVVPEDTVDVSVSELSVLVSVEVFVSFVELLTVVLLDELVVEFKSFDNVLDIVFVVVVAEFAVFEVIVFVVVVVSELFSDVANTIFDKLNAKISNNIVTFIILFIFILNLQVINIRL